MDKSSHYAHYSNIYTYNIPTCYFQTKRLSPDSWCKNVRPRFIQRPLNPHHLRLRVSWQLVRSGQWAGYITYGMVWYLMGQGSSPGEGKRRIENHEEDNGKPPRFIFPQT